MPLEQNEPLTHHHGGRQDGSRLRPLVDILESNPYGVSTLDIDKSLRARGCFNMAISTSIADLRKSKYPVSKGKYLRTTENGRKIYFYKKEAADGGKTGNQIQAD